MLYISGQLPVDGATGTMAEGIEAQTHQSLKNLGHILREAGLDYANVVKTTVLLDSIADFAAMNAIYATYFTSAMVWEASSLSACLNMILSVSQLPIPKVWPAAIS